MRCVRFILPLGVFLIIVVLTGALGQQPGKTPTQSGTAKKETMPPPKPDAEATKILKDAVLALAAQPWLETTFWQQAEMQGLTFQAKGKYLAEPKTRRARLELTVHVGNATGTLEVVSDGTVVWEKVQIAKGAKPEIRKTELKKILDALKSVNQEQVQAALLQTQALAGVTPLLQNIHDQMTVTKQEKAAWQDREVIKLTAVWSEAMTKGLLPPNASWPPFLPRKCFLYLDRKEGAVPYWPYRIEWWGPSTSSQDDGLLLQMEFREPKVVPALAADQQQRVFTFDPGVAQVTDQTRESTERARNRAGQLSGQRSRYQQP
jgi:hypothetical protein